MVDRETALLQAAFRDLHGQRLHGFALLVTLGNRPVAAAVASRALGEGARRALELRHPERAAAWLRSRVLRLLPHDHGWLTRESEPERRGALRVLGAPDEVFDALASLPTVERAALIAAEVERLEARDIESIVGRRDADARQLVKRARRTYLSVAGDAGDSIDRAADPAPGSLSRRIAAEAARTMGRGTVRP